MTPYRWSGLIVSLLLIVGSYVGYQRGSEGLADTTTQTGGAELAERRCVLCHMLPDPGDLPRSGWTEFFKDKPSIFENYVALRGVDSLLVPPQEEYDEIVEYYLANAPTQESMLAPVDEIPPVDWLVAGVRRLVDESATGIEAYTDVKVDTLNNRVLLTDLGSGSIQLFDYAGNAAGAIRVGLAPGRMESLDRGYLVALMAGPAAGIVWADVDWTRPERSTVEAVVPNLARPIRAHGVSLFGVDGLLVEDFAAVGNGVHFRPRTGKHEYGGSQRIVDAPGAVGSEVLQLDIDERPELLVLVSEEREQLLLFPNVGEELPDPTVVFQGRPGFGFNGLVAADVNNDGRTDLVTLNGDNYDIATGPLKPYHGLRIFLNQGDLGFEAPVFLPFHGVIGVVVGDFDLDGDQDILSISAFPDYRTRPFRTAVVFEQVRPMEFHPREVAAASGSRWVAAAAADFDGDGDLDFVLGGAYTRSTEADRRWSDLAGPDASTLLFLTNTTIGGDPRVGQRPAGGRR